MDETKLTDKEIEKATEHYFKIKELMRAEKQDRILTIIVEKGLPLAEIDIIKQTENYEKYVIAYNWVFNYGWINFEKASTQKSQEEYDLLKEMLDNA